MDSDIEERFCHSCDEKFPLSSLKRCSGCRKVWYCSSTCQKESWPVHIFVCKEGQPISTVYHLGRAMARDVVPVDHQTRVDYGFDKAARMIGGNAESKLCGLYQGLLHYREVPYKELRRWQKEGKLVEGIKATYEAIPPEYRGGYYPWFLQHQWVFDGTPVDEAAESRLLEAQIEPMLRKAWVYAGKSPSDTVEEIRSGVDALPEHKRACFGLCSMLLGGGHPGPDTDAWVTFGFVARDERDHARKYQELIQRCTFEELCDAYETSSIPALFDRHNIGFQFDAMVNRSHLSLDVMSGSPTMFKSVWRLKQYVDRLAAADLQSPPVPVRSVQWDYGYVNCRNAEDRKLLDDLYTKLLTEPHGVDPLALHAACLKGELLEFARQSVTLAPWTAKYTRLLKNAYPLQAPDA